MTSMSLTRQLTKSAPMATQHLSLATREGGEYHTFSAIFAENALACLRRFEVSKQSIKNPPIRGSVRLSRHDGEGREGIPPSSRL